MSKTFVITAKAENVLRVLQRMSSLITRKRLKIQEMKVGSSNSFGESHLYLILHADENCVQWLMKQLGKLVDLFDVELKLVNAYAAPLQQITTQLLREQEWRKAYAFMNETY
jgi:acetolactate synthase small subunit